ncbi:MAG: winged helix-turn-helix transcriptional regulator [Acidobacteria bacterium]|nr:winged helix-turn-helix transcriptional regulator [Acidobacteriota bacterium]
MSAEEDDVRSVLRHYPQIYIACHVDHVRAASTEWQLSAHDSSILSHLDAAHATSPRALAQHLAVQPSTLSASIARLESLGYITSTPSAGDKRRRELLLTERGEEAMAATSVLDCERVRELLATLSKEERIAAVHGLALLARAALSLKEKP